MLKSWLHLPSQRRDSPVNLSSRRVLHVRCTCSIQRAQHACMHECNPHHVFGWLQRQTLRRMRLAERTTCDESQ